MKRRVAKKRLSRALRAARRACKRELGDHRRYGWQATMPLIVKDDPVFGCDVEVTFDPRWGRLYRPLKNFADSDGS